MFDFSTELILNSTTGVSVLTSATDKSLAASENALLIKKYNKFRNSYVKAIYQNVGTQPVKEVVTLALASVTVADLVGKVVRISADVRLSGSQDGAYSRWAVNKGKPLYSELFVPASVTTPTLLATAIRNNFNKNFPVTNIVASGATTNVVFTAADEYQRIDNLKLEVIENASQDNELGIVAEATKTTAGAEGFGTAWYLVKNLRLPTIESTRFMGLGLDEKPVDGGLYDQFTFELEAPRNITGQGAVGQAIVSRTYHIVYVLQSQSAAFKALVLQAHPSKLFNAKTKVAITA